jgi:hypothetical protein
MPLLRVLRWRPLNTEALLRSKVSSREICGGQSVSDSFFPPITYVFPSLAFHQFSIPFIYMLLLPQGQTSEAWKASTHESSFETRRGAGGEVKLDRKVLALV